MAKRRSHSIAFKRQAAQEFLAGATLHEFAKRRDISRTVLSYRPRIGFGHHSESRVAFARCEPPEAEARKRHAGPNVACVSRRPLSDVNDAPRAALNHGRSWAPCEGASQARATRPTRGSLPRGGPAIDDEHRALAVARFVRGEVEARIGHFLSGARTLHRA